MIQDDATFLGFGSEQARPVGKPLELGEYIAETYHLRRVLGRGGMSHVYEAEDIRLSRKVAIKILDDAELGATSLVMEARALAAVRHPGLPVVYGLGVHRGWTYLVLERLYGIDLERHLTRRDGTAQLLDPQEGLPILASIADVLGAVHRAGLAHRDVKPSNVMLCPMGRVVLLDFGIMIPEVDAAQIPRCGTPRYLAPEVICGGVAAGRAHLADIYAFGAVAFEMFSGQPVFDADTMVKLLEHHVSATPPDLGALRPTLPRPLVDLVHACLAKRPGDRPGDMESIAGDLRAIRKRLDGDAARPRMKIGELRETYRQVSARKAKVAEAPPPPAAPIDATAIPPSWEVLIVEDDEDIREGLAAVLSARGFRTHVAANGREAQELIARGTRRPHVILLDLMMPVMDGRAFLEEQPRHPTLDGVPVLLVTAQPSEAELRFPSVRGVIPKPLALPQLLRTLDAVCTDSLPTQSMDPIVP